MLLIFATVYIEFVIFLNTNEVWFIYIKPKHFSCRPLENFLFFSFGLLFSLNMKYILLSSR